MKRPEFAVAPKWREAIDRHGFQNTINEFAPYQGAGIAVEYVSPDFSEIRVRMELTPDNLNYVGTHFGGSLYAMADPFFMFILMKQLGDDYIVWDKTAGIEFLKPGTGTVRAVFRIDAGEIRAIREITARERRTDRTYVAEITGERSEIVARVTKTLYVRMKRRT